MIHPLITILGIIFPFMLVSGMVHAFIVPRQKVSTITTIERATLFAVRQGLYTGILWALAFDLDIYINAYDYILYAIFYALEVALFLWYRQDHHLLHFILSTVSAIIVGTNATLILTGTMCARTTMPIYVFVHESLRLAISLLVL